MKEANYGMFNLCCMTNWQVNRWLKNGVAMLYCRLGSFHQVKVFCQLLRHRKVNARNLFSGEQLVYIRVRACVSTVVKYYVSYTRFLPKRHFVNSLRVKLALTSNTALVLKLHMHEI